MSGIKRTRREGDQRREGEEVWGTDLRIICTTNLRKLSVVEETLSLVGEAGGEEFVDLVRERGERGESAFEASSCLLRPEQSNTPFLHPKTFAPLLLKAEVGREQKPPTNDTRLIHLRRPFASPSRPASFRTAAQNHRVRKLNSPPPPTSFLHSCPTTPSTPQPSRLLHPLHRNSQTPRSTPPPDPTSTTYPPSSTKTP